MNQSLHSAQSADDVVVVVVFFFFSRQEKEKTQNRRPVHRSSIVFFFCFFFFFFITFYRATSWLRAYPLLKWSSTIFLLFFFSCHLVAQSRHTAQSVLDHFPSFFFIFHATSWLRANTLLNRSSTVYSFITPPRGSEQTCCTIAPNHFFFFNNYPLLFPFDATSWLRTETNPGRDHTPRALPKGQVRKKVSMA